MVSGQGDERSSDRELPLAALKRGFVERRRDSDSSGPDPTRRMPTPSSPRARSTWMAIKVLRW